MQQCILKMKSEQNEWQSLLRSLEKESKSLQKWNFTPKRWLNHSPLLLKTVLSTIMQFNSLKRKIYSFIQKKKKITYMLVNCTLACTITNIIFRKKKWNWQNLLQISGAYLKDLTRPVLGMTLIECTILDPNTWNK